MKLSKATTNIRKFVDSKSKASIDLQNKAIFISQSINTDYNDNLEQIITLCSQDIPASEVKGNKDYIMSKIGKTENYISHLELSFRIAGSKVIKAKFKACNNNIKKFVDSVIKETEKPFSQTSINDYKNKRLVDDKGNIIIKPKKEKVKKNNVVTIATIPYQKLTIAQLQALYDNAGRELNRRAKEQKQA